MREESPAARIHASYYKKIDWSEPVPEKLVDYVLELVPEDTRLLDVGCGPGVLLREARAKKKCEVCGVDFLPHFVNRLRKEGFEVKLCDIEREKIPFKGRFDVITMTEVIEHLFDPLSVLKKLRGKLKRGGYLILSTPNTFSLKYRLMFLLGRNIFACQSPLHIRFFSKNILKRLLDQAGFVADKWNSFSWLPLSNKLFGKVIFYRVGALDSLLSLYLVVRAKRL
ncbi:MAG: class I SAM-dependent methyltransferase [Nanoarchaeota archaeon]|nr:class I SAM-dependent methyltransferase [Nanoarchaeota archaeon]